MYLVKVAENDDENLNLEDLKLTYTSIVYYRDVNEQGQEEWKEYQRLESAAENRIWVNLSDISPYVKEAYLAVEDKDFYTHIGFNIKRTIFAALNELSHALTGSFLASGQQGASTIEQQLIKNITGDKETDVMRKFREIFRAVSLDKRYSKDMILEAYLNTVGLTGNIGGVQAGANRYFNKDVGSPDLTIAEAASIAAITKNPTQYSPIANPQAHLKRRNDVLYFMFQQGRINEAEYNAAIAEPLKLSEKRVDENAAIQSNNDYFVDMLIDDVIDDLMKQKDMTKDEATNYFYTKGLRIYSTVVPSLQKNMQDVFNRDEYWPDYAIENWQPKNNKGEVILNKDGTAPEPKTITTNACGVSLNYQGEICAVVGGLGQKTADRTLNRAIDSLRQVGSTMKPVAAYPLAIEYDIANYSRTQEDSPLQDGVFDETGKAVEGWPRNYNNTWSQKPLTVQYALAQSTNTIAVKWGKLVGKKEMFDFAHDTLEMTSLVEPNDVDLAPMVLGSMTHGVEPYKLAAAYQMYGNGGVYYSPHSYVSVELADGTVVLSPDVNKVQAISPDTAYIMNRLLATVMKPGGTANGMAASKAGMDSVGKTGTSTTSDGETKDVWFVGLTPYYVTSMWWGYDQGDVAMTKYNPGRQKHPGASAWKEIMNTEQADAAKYPVKNFPVDETVKKLAYCTESGAAAGPACPQAVGYYKANTNLGVCTLHAG